MSGPQRPFDPAELRDPAGGGPSDTELAGLLSTARTLEDVARADAAHPSGAFTDRVMAAVASERRPRRAGAIPFVGPFVLALATAWRTATSGEPPLAVRAPALAFVLLVVVAAASLGTMATVGVAGFLSGEREAPPSVRPAPSPLVAPSEVAPVPSPSLTPSPSPSPSATPSPTPSPSPTSAAPTGTPDDEATDERRETDEPNETDEPDETDEPRQTDEPRETDEPEETEGHGEGESSEGEP